MKRRSLWIIALIFALGTFSGILLTARFNLSPQGIAQVEKSGLPTTEGTSPFVKVAGEVMPAVVNIAAERTIKISTEHPFQFEAPEWPEWFKKFFESPQIPHTEKAQSLGSGFIFAKHNKDYYILTNNHVIKGADKIIVTLSDKSVYKGKDVKVVGKDLRTDVAVLKINSDHELPVVKLGNSDQIQIGDWAIAIGNPFGLERTVTVGVISAKGRSQIVLPEGPSYQDFIQTDAAINMGNSGGPLVNIQGEVMGMNTAITSPSGGSVGIGFAIPINLAKSVAEQLMEKGKVVRGYLGIRPDDITPELAEAYNLKEVMGAIVAEVVENTPAEKAGIKKGDIIITVNDKEIKDANSLRIMIADITPGTAVKITVVREGGKKENFRIKLVEYPEELAQKEETPLEEGEEDSKVTWLGMTVVGVNALAAQVYQLEEKEGVVVTSVAEDSPAGDAEIERGDVINKVGEKKISNLADFSEAKKLYENSKKAIVFHIEMHRRGEPVSKILAIRPESG